MDYPIFSDVMVNGPETHDVFKFLRYNSELLKKSENLTREVWIFYFIKNFSFKLILND